MRKIISLILLGIFVFINSFYAEEWHVKKSDSNLVKFTSTTPVLDFDGTTSKIDGYIYWKGKEFFSEGNEIYFEVDLNSVETGIGKRDTDMREDVLETDQWAKTWYRGTIVSVEKSKDENTHNLKSNGIMFIHGLEKEIEVNAKAIVENNKMQIISDFSVFLNDYKIEAPSLLAFIKVAEEIKLHLDFQLEKASEK